VDFLQSQGSADVKVAPGSCRYSLWLDHKGLIHGDAFVLRVSEEQALLVSYETPAEILINKFERHIIADDVTIEDVTSTWRLLSVPSESSEPLLAGRPRELLPESFIVEAEGYLFSGHRLGKNTLEYLIPEGVPLPVEINSLSIESAEARRIQSAIPSIPRDIGAGRFNPLEAALLHAVSFSKGCYLGQEVVARVHRLQRYAKRMVTLTSESFPCERLELPYVLELEGKKVGELTSAVDVSGTCHAIAWLKGKFIDGEHRLSGHAWRVRSIESL